MVCIFSVTYLNLVFKNPNDFLLGLIASIVSANVLGGIIKPTNKLVCVYNFRQHTMEVNTRRNITPL